MDMDMGTARMLEKNPRNLFGLLLAFLAATSLAQSGNTPGSITNLSGSNTPSGSLSSQGLNEEAQPAYQKRTWTIKPKISLTETWTDNANINRAAGNKEADFITEISPGIRIEANTARLKAYLDYSLRGQFYAKSDYSRTQNALNAFGTFEAIDNWLYFDFSGVIAQQAISAFGAQSASSSTINSNSTETSTYRLSPYIKGKLIGSADYFLRYNRSTTSASSSNGYGVDLSEWAAQLKGDTPLSNLQWTLDGSQQTASYDSGRETDAARLTARLTYAITPQFRVSGSGGEESNNYASADQQTRTTHGYGLDWNPTERTQLSLFNERRFFGDGHRYTLSHRFPRSSIQFSDTRDVSILPNQFASVGLGTVYDLYFNQFASLIPDPAQRAAFVSALLAQPGAPDPNTQVTSSFLSSRASIQRRQQLSLLLLGVRNSITFMANRNISQSIFAGSTLNDDFSNTSEVRQTGYSINYGHQLSQISSLNFLASRQKSTSGGGVNLNTTISIYQLNVSTKLGTKTTGSLSLRHTDSDGNATFKESALLGTISYIY